MFSVPVCLLQEAVTEFASRASEKLHKQDCHTSQVLVFFWTKSFRQQVKQYFHSTVVPLRRPTDDNRAISQAALMGLANNYKPGYRYAKAGVMLLARNDARVDQWELALEETAALLRETGGPRMMQALDAMNERYGRGALLLAIAGLACDLRVWA